MSGPRNIFAWTAPGADNPAFVSINEQSDGRFTIDARDIVRDGKCGATIQITLPRTKLADMAKALEDRVAAHELFRLMPKCPVCGNKRCPKATDKKLACTNSNAAHSKVGATMQITIGDLVWLSVVVTGVGIIFAILK